MLDARSPAADSTAPANGPVGMAGRVSHEESLAARLETACALVEVSRLVTRLLRLARPDVGDRSERIARLVAVAARRLELRQSWEFEVAARLSQVGWLGLPAAVVTAVRNGETLDDDELLMAASHALIARDLLAGITRLEGVAEMVARQSEPVSLPGEPPVPLAARDRRDVGGQLLRVGTELERLMSAGMAVTDAIARLRAHPAEYDPEILTAMEAADISPFPERT